MSYVAADAPFTVQTLNDEGVASVLAGTPLESYARHFAYYAQSYGIDVNWALAYIKWENGFGSANTISMRNNNPWDMLCYPGQWGAVGEDHNANGTCYATYPDMGTGIEAGFRQWRKYIDDGYDTWFASLSRAQCGTAAGCGNNWAPNVIATAQGWAAKWPYDGKVEEPPSPFEVGGTPVPVTPFGPTIEVPKSGWTLMLGGAIIVGAAWMLASGAGKNEVG